MKFRDYQNNALINANNEKDTIVEADDLEQIFNINVDKKGNYIFNLNSTIYLQLKDCDLLCYTTKTDTYDWPLLSYKIYGSTHFAWLLMKLNNITAKNVFNLIPAGTNIKCIGKDYLQAVMNKITDFQ